MYYIDTEIYKRTELKDKHIFIFFKGKQRAINRLTVR